MTILDQFEIYLNNNLPHIESFHPHYNDALSRMILAGGKRFRPRLLLSVVEALDSRMIENSFPVALGIEMLHTYSLIHDDLPSMDNAPLRRGNATLHTVYDETTAVLAGDALNTHAFYMLASAPLNPKTVVKLVKMLARDGGAYGMVLGQAIDCHFEDQHLPLDQVAFIHNHKTGVLIAASLAMGAMICEAGEKLEEALHRFGIRLGLLFQVQDDIIDATQSDEEAGKTTGNDGEKNSFTNLMGLEGAQAYKANLLDELMTEAQESFPAALAEKLTELMAGYFKA